MRPSPRLARSQPAVSAAVLALALTLLSCAAASTRPRTPDEFLSLLLWAEAAGARAEAGAGAGAALEAVEAEQPLPSALTPPDPQRLADVAAEWREQHKALFRKDGSEGGGAKKPAPALKKVVTPKSQQLRPTTPTTLATAAPASSPAASPSRSPLTPPPPPPPPVWSPPPADTLADPLLPAYEEYDRSERFSHSFLHGFRPF